MNIIGAWLILLFIISKKRIEGFSLKDTTCLNASQQFAGNGNDNIVYYYNDNIFCPMDFGFNENYCSNSDSILKRERGRTTYKLTWKVRLVVLNL